MLIWNIIPTEINLWAGFLTILFSLLFTYISMDLVPFQRDLMIPIDIPLILLMWILPLIRVSNRSFPTRSMKYQSALPLSKSPLVMGNESYMIWKISV